MIKGTRVMVSIVLDALADGISEAEILAEYPHAHGRGGPGGGSVRRGPRPRRIPCGLGFLRVKVDENLPDSALAPLSEAGIDVDTVTDEGLAGADDPAVLDAASLEKRLVLTMDRATPCRRRRVLVRVHAGRDVSGQQGCQLPPARYWAMA